jgi:hypothetical protein
MGDGGETWEGEGTARGPAVAVAPLAPPPAALEAVTSPATASRTSSTISDDEEQTEDIITESGVPTVSSSR